MRNITTTLALFLTSMGAFAQVTEPAKQLGVSELTNDKTEQRIFLKATSKTNENWFTGEVSSSTLAGNTLFVLEKKDNGYVLKRLASNNYIQPEESKISFGEQSSAQSFELLDIKQTDINDGDLTGKEPYTRFKKSDKEIYLNVQRFDGQPKYASGKGAWSIVNVYDATDYSIVTLNITKEGATETIKQVYKTGDKIVPPAYEGFTAKYTETTKTNNDSQTLEVNYVSDAAADITATVTLGKEVMKTQGKVGYPSDATLYTALQEKITAAETAQTTEAGEAIHTAIAALYNATEVNLPVDGKTYTFTNHHLTTDGTMAQNYLKCTAEELTLVGRASSTAEQYPLEAKFTCHQLTEGKYLFVNNLGKYLVLKGNKQSVGTNNNKGFVDTYDATYCPMTIKKDAQGTGEKLFGLVSFGAKRVDENNQESYFTITFGNNNYSFNQSRGFAFLNTNDHSTLFQIEEVAYPNQPALKPIEGNAVVIDGAKSLATFSAPFATTLPEGVSAYYVGQLTTDNVARLTALTGGIIPANTGVILTSAEATGKEVLMIPSIEAGEAVADNKLGHSAGAVKAFTNETFYVLGKVDNTVGFFKGKANTTLGMNKAYLMSETAAPAIKLEFGQEVTGIENVAGQPESANAPVYDLSGRRVSHTVKGGFYIQNGKKFIVK